MHLRQKNSLSVLPAAWSNTVKVAVHDTHAVGHEVVAVHVGNTNVVEEGRGLGRVLEEPGEIWQID